ncbi:MAG: C39 family peptidase [Verrucomicrobiota bacterium]
MKRIFLIGFCCSVSTGVSLAIPNSFTGNGGVIVVPAQPRFNADLTEEFFEVENWEANRFSGPWMNQPALGDDTVRRMRANPTVFGSVPMSVYSYGEAGETRELAIHFLDAGPFFGYQYGGERSREQREAGSEKRAEFSRLFRELKTDLTRRLETGCGRGAMGTIGRSEALRTVYTEYRFDEFVIRLVARNDHSISLHLYRSDAVPSGYVDPQMVRQRGSERAGTFLARVDRSEMGDIAIDGMPMLLQGNTPYCGIHSVAMVGHYLGLRVPPETLAAGADFQNTGSARGSDLYGLYDSIAAEVGMKARRNTSLRMDRIEDQLEDGIPVIVWRRVSMDREKVHDEHLLAWRRDPSVSLPEPTPEDRAAYPVRDLRGSPSHASILTGFNREDQVVLFTEPWGDRSRNRRMRYEEMEATVYQVFSFSL